MATKKRTAKKGSSKKKTASSKKTKAKTSTKVRKKATSRPKAKKATRTSTGTKKIVKKPAGKTTKKAQKKPAAKKSAAQKKPTNKANAVKKRAHAVAGVRETLAKTLAKRTNGKKYKLSPAEKRALKRALQELRDRVVDEITFLAGDNLNRSQREVSGDLSGYSIHMADQGTDNFDREFALNLVSSEQDALYEIDEALQRLGSDTYGICEECECAIEKARLEALPFARMCIKCKSASEKGRTRYRPFGPTITKG